ncbi:hypothetical protein CPB84DRAFT_1785390, partial [Gymnopilus junonius]
MKCSSKKCLELFIPNCDLLHKMLREKCRSVRDGKVGSQCKNKFNEKLAIHQNPRKCTTDKHAEHEPLNLDSLLLTNFGWVHIGEEVWGRPFRYFFRLLSCCYIRSTVFGLSGNLLQLCCVRALYQSLADPLIQLWEVSCKSITALSMTFNAIWVTSNPRFIARNAIYNRSRLAWLLGLIELEHKIIHQRILGLSSLFSLLIGLRLSRWSNTIPAIKPKLEVCAKLFSMCFRGITHKDIFHAFEVLTGVDRVLEAAVGKV